MYARPILVRRSALSIAVAAALAGAIAVGILSAVVGLFRSEGLPMEQLAAAERACASHAYVSERESCMREQVAALRGQHVAGK
jgi:hypothetical protein